MTLSRNPDQKDYPEMKRLTPLSVILTGMAVFDPPVPYILFQWQFLLLEDIPYMPELKLLHI